jgi:uncharacterized protein (TIGR02147 family)
MSKKELRQAAEEIQPSAFLDAKEYLAGLYARAKASIEQYSYVRFTEDLGFGACNAMYLIIHGKRPLTKKGAEKIAAALGMTGVEKRYLVNLAQAHSVTKKGERAAAFDRLVELKARTVPTELDRQQLEFYNEWHHAVILELLALPDAKDDAEWIAASLTPGVTPLKVEKSLELLKKLGHIKLDPALGRHVPSNAVLSTGGEVVGMAVMRYHQQMIGLAKDALTDVDPFQRDVSAVTIAMPAGRIDELKAKIQAFRKELLALSAGAADADSILQVNVQLFPVARAAGKGKKSDD